MFDALFTRYSRIVFFDTETTGLDPDKDDQIIELAAISVDRNGNEMEMDDYIKLHLKDEIPERIIQLTGILPVTLTMEGVEEHEAVKRFWEAAEPESGLFDDPQTLLVAHNAHFDLLFLAYAQIRAKKEHGLLEEYEKFKDADYLDTLTLYRDRKSYPHKLESAIREYGLSGKVQNSHRAVDDCRALYEVAKKMWEEKPDLAEYINLFGFLKKYGPEKHPFKKVTYAPQGFDSARKPLYQSF